MSESRCLLMSDLVDSTGLAERLGHEQAAALWATHDDASRKIMRKWGGREIDKRDGFLILFDKVEQAIGYAAAYNDTLRGLPGPMRARIGIHHGLVTLRYNDPDDIATGAKPIEVDGLAKSVAARAMSIAGAGQILITAHARCALEVDQSNLEPLGHWRVKGVASPIELFGLGEAQPEESDKAYRVALRNDVWVPLREVRHSLPSERNAFVGRRGALEVLSTRFRERARLVSVLGMGGIGKSRLVLRYGWNWLGDYAGGVWFCDLSQARTLDGIAYAVAQGLDVPLGAGDAIQQLGNAMAGRGECLVICDNFEQVASLAEMSLGRWLDMAPQARFLATTREVLGIRGETLLPLTPMEPAEAAELFRLRASAASGDSTSRAEDQPLLDSLVRLLDGLPLAIELAAARARLMSPRELLNRMRERFKVLASAGRRHDRQATLRTTFDWSWALLSSTEKAAFAQLSVFELGFTVRAAEAVLCLPSVGGEIWSLDVLQMLVEKSLVRRVDSDRFDMLSSVQEYAAEHLATDGRFEGSGAQAMRLAQARHWRYFASLPQQEAVSGRCVETENLVVACRRATAEGDSICAVGCLERAWAALRLRGPFTVALDLAAAVGRMAGLAAGDKAVALLVIGSAQGMLGRGAEAKAAFESGLSLARQAIDRGRVVELLCALGERLTQDGLIDEAKTSLTEARAIAAELGKATLQCRVANELGGLAFSMSRTNEAQDHYASALELARGLGDRHWECGLLGNLAVLLHGAGRHQDALGYYERALALAEETGDRRWRGNTHCNLGLLLHETGRTAQALEQFELAACLALELGHRRLAAMVDCNTAIALESKGELELALAKYESALAIANELGDRRSRGQFNGYLGALYARLGRIENAREALALGEESLQSVDDHLSLGLLLCQRVRVERAAGEAKAANQAFERARQLQEELGNDEGTELAKALKILALLVPCPADT